VETRAFAARARPDSGRARRRFSPRHLVLLLAGTIAGCGAERPETDPAIVLTDDLGAAVVLPAPARRVVSLAPSHTDLLFAIGAGDRVVGRTQWASWPPEALDVPSVGDGLNPNVEAIAGYQPDLVVAYASAANATATSQLAELGVPVFNLRTDRLDDVARGARLLGQLTGYEAAADSLAAVFAAALDSARRSVPAGPRPRALLLAWEQPPIVIGGGSFQSEILRLAGVENVFSDIAQPSAQVTIETIVARDPDVVVRLGSTGIPAWAARPEWRAIRAVRERRFVGVEGLEFEHPSFRALDGVRRLRAALEGVVD
jgi:iron complex transport system substrate-binding protein